MNIQLKSYLLIILTLVIGMAIGAMTHRAVQRHTCGPAMMHPGMGPGPGMDKGPGSRFKPDWKKSRNMEEIIAKKFKWHLDPTDEQWEKVKPILKEHAKKFKQSMDTHKQEMKDMMDALEKDLAPHLTPEQMEKLKAMKERRKKGFHRMHRKFGKDRWKEMKKRKMEVMSE